MLSECRNVIAHAIQRLREELGFYGETFPAVQMAIRFAWRKSLPKPSTAIPAGGCTKGEFYSSAIDSNVKQLTSGARY
jgi:hypothetical protein